MRRLAVVANKVTPVTFDLDREDYDACCHGYANAGLWAVFHNRVDRARFDAGYLDVHWWREQFLETLMETPHDRSKFRR